MTNRIHILNFQLKILDGRFQIICKNYYNFATRNLKISGIDMRYSFSIILSLKEKYEEYGGLSN